MWIRMVYGIGLVGLCMVQVWLRAMTGHGDVRGLVIDSSVLYMNNMHSVVGGVCK